MRRDCLWLPAIFLVALVLTISESPASGDRSIRILRAYNGGSHGIEENVAYGPQALRLDIYKPAERITGARPAFRECAVSSDCPKPRHADEGVRPYTK